MSSSSHSSSYSTADTKSYQNDLGLDPSDPLNLLLHNTSQSADSSMEEFSSGESASPPDWSELTALWQENKYVDQSSGQMKQFPDVMGFGNLTSLPMDMDFNPSMSIEPSMLHFDPMKFSNPPINYTFDDQSSYRNLNTDLLFTFQTSLNNGGLSIPSPSLSPASPPYSEKGRRLSVTSTSSSGPSFSPVPESIPSPATGYTSDSAQQQQQDTNHDSAASATYSNNPAAELANRVRQSAGVMVAVPMGAQLQGHSSNQHSTQPSKPPSYFRSDLLALIIFQILIPRLNYPSPACHDSYSPSLPLPPFHLQPNQPLPRRRRRLVLPPNSI